MFGINQIAQVNTPREAELQNQLVAAQIRYENQKKATGLALVLGGALGALITYAVMK